MSGFTKGEWNIDGEWIECNGSPVCVMGDYWVTYDNSAANAHLIAAAPKMYSALELLLNNSSFAVNFPSEHEQIEKAIEQARGEV